MAVALSELPCGEQGMGLPSSSWAGLFHCCFLEGYSYPSNPGPPPGYLCPCSLGSAFLPVEGRIVLASTESPTLL